MWQPIVALFQEYMGTGLVVIWYLISVLFLLLREEDRTRRCLFVWTPLLILLFFFNPVFGWLVMEYADSEIYYRILWLLPMSVTIAYTLVTVSARFSGIRRIAILAVSAAVLICAGKPIYRNGAFTRAENAYHVPQAVIDICDEIVIPGREVMAVFPESLLNYVRQYTGLVCMPYGRDYSVERWKGDSDLHVAMNREEIDGEELGTLSAEEGCHYIILPEEQTLLGEIPGFVYYRTIDGYLLYRSTTADFTQWK